MPGRRSSNRRTATAQYNMKYYAFYGAFFNPGAASGVTLVCRLGERGFSEEWLCKIPLAVHIEGDVKVLDSGLYEVWKNPEFCILLDPAYKNRIDRVSVSGYPASLGPAACERKSHSAGSGSAWGGKCHEKFTFQGATPSASSFAADVSYLWKIESFSVDDKDQLRPEGDGGSTGFSFTVRIETKRDSHQKITEPKQVIVTATPVEVKEPGLVSLTASVTGVGPDDAPLTYAWSGITNSQDATATLDVQDSGTYTVTCAVADARGGSVGSGEVQIKADLKREVRLVKDAPAGDQLRLGETARFHAEVTQHGKPVTHPAWIYRWQPNSEVDFDPPEGPANATTATFRKTGPAKIFVEVLVPRGPALATLAASDTLDLEVLAPELTLLADLANPFTGQEVKVSVQDAPGLDPKNVSFWWEIAGRARMPAPCRTTAITPSARGTSSR